MGSRSGDADPVADAATSIQYGSGATYHEIVHRRMTRRGLLKAGMVVTALAAAGPVMALARPASVAAAQENPPSPTFTFQRIAPDTTDEITVAPGYRSQVLIGWGDPVLPGAPAFDLNNQSAAAQELQFGYNCDFVMFLPLPLGSNNPNEGLLWVNHEYTDPRMMFPAFDWEARSRTAEQVEIELAAHGGSLIHVNADQDGVWSYDPNSAHNRRVTLNTLMVLTGPAAGHELLRTADDPSGTMVAGTINNCGGGLTPWPTVLIAEENLHQYFANAGALPAESPNKAQFARYSVPNAANEFRWNDHQARFDVAQYPNEPNRFGWMVEIDPYDPGFIPSKRTALGRFKHEAAGVVLAANQHAVVYMGDDERFDYVYKFVSDGTFDANNRSANRGLLENGTLYVARLNDNGSGEWLPLTFGQGPLTAENGFSSQADLLIRVRMGADLLGATKMDRPEDIDVSPATGKVYVTMTNNTQRATEGRPNIDAANPRPRNAWGHIIELTEGGDDHTATTFQWEIFILAGDPADESTFFQGFPKDQVSPIGCPDNIAFDSQGNLWIATDGQPSSLKINDGIYGVATDGWDRGQVKQLLSSVAGSEVASLVITPSSQALFASIQHPGEEGTLEAPTSTWPNGVAIPSVVVVTREDGRPIGT